MKQMGIVRCVAALALVALMGGHGIQTAVVAAGLAEGSASSFSGPLRVHRTNPRYFTDDSGRAIYLTGSHTWNSLQDWPVDYTPLDFNVYLNWLQEVGHNFFKLRAWEATTASPLPYARISDTVFDLSQFDQSYFDRIRDRVMAARDRGIYVAIMLFQWRETPDDIPTENPHFMFVNHPFHPANNINGIDPDQNGNGKAEELHTLLIPAVTAVQEAYVRQVVDTVNDFDNVIYEISNESPVTSEAWQHYMMQVIRNHEAGRKQHPILMSLMWPDGTDEQLFSSPADAISPGGLIYQEDPPVMDGRKVVLSDPDHFTYPLFMGDSQWVWRTFMRGGHPIPLDVLPEHIPGFGSGGYLEYADQVALDAMRWAMGRTRVYAERVNLAAMQPRSDISSAGYALVAPGSEYLIYEPSGGSFVVTMTDGVYDYEWFDVSNGTVISTGSIDVDDGDYPFEPPIGGEVILYLKASGGNSPPGGGENDPPPPEDPGSELPPPGDCEGNCSPFISQTVPASMVAGESYSVSIAFRNTGSTTWIRGTEPTTETYWLGSQNPQDNNEWGPGRHELPTDAPPESRRRLASRSPRRPLQVITRSNGESYRIGWNGSVI